MALVGLKNIHYAKITEKVSNGVTTETYGTLTKIGNAVSVDIQPQTQKAALYGDDMAVATSNGRDNRYAQLIFRWQTKQFCSAQQLIASTTR